MIKYKKETQEVDVIDDITCNNCGNSCKTYDGFEGLLETEVTGGYSSGHIGDTNRYIFSICEKCLMKIIKNFKIPADFSTDHVWDC